MNKYQQDLLSRGTYSLTAEKGDGKVEFINDILTFSQNENYFILSYSFCVESPLIDSIQIGDSIFPSSDGKVIVEIDFSKKFKEVCFRFANGFADPCTVEVEYIEANKEKYDKKLNQLRHEELLNAMDSMLRTGRDLVSIFWKNADKEVIQTIVKLFACEEKNLWQMNEVELKNDTHFYTFINLAFGRYKIVISQYDAAGEELLSHDFQFAIYDPFDKLNEDLQKINNHVKPHSINKTQSLHH